MSIQPEILSTINSRFDEMLAVMRQQQGESTPHVDIPITKIYNNQKKNFNMEDQGESSNQNTVESEIDQTASAIQNTVQSETDQTVSSRRKQEKIHQMRAEEKRTRNKLHQLG